MFRNNDSISVGVVGAELSWKFDPPRMLPKGEGKLTVAEAGGSLRLHAKSDGKEVRPSSTKVFCLPDDLSELALTVLASDVPDEAIAINVFSDQGTAWRAAGDEIPVIVRDVMQSIVDSLP